MTDSPVPRSALLLGLAGLAPSLAVVAVMALRPGWRDAAAIVGLGYGALIASFIGGAWWGLAAARAEPAALPRMLLRSVVPSLSAWPALLIRPEVGFMMLAAIFVSLLPMDRELCRKGLAPGWWYALRLPLSLAMAGLHASALAILLVSGG